MHTQGIAIGDSVAGCRLQRGLDIANQHPSMVVLNFATTRMSDSELTEALKRLREQMSDGAFIRVAEADLAHPGQRYHTHSASNPPKRDVIALCSIIENVGMVPRIVECWRGGTLTINDELIKLAPIQRSALLDQRFHDPAMRFSSLIVDALVDSRVQAARHSEPRILEGFRQVTPADPRKLLQQVKSVDQLKEVPNSYVELPYGGTPLLEWPECFPPQAIERMKVCHTMKTWPLAKVLAPILARTDDTFISLAPKAEGTLVWNDSIFREPGYLRLVPLGEETAVFAANKYYVNTEVGNVVELPKMAVFFDGNVRYYSHWICDALVPLLTLRDTAICEPVAMLPADMPRFVHESLELLKIPLVTLPEGTKWARIQSAFWVTGIRTPIYYTDDLRKLGHEMRDLAGSKATGHRILIERQSVRRIVNHTNLADCLAGLGFISVRLEEMTFVDQVRLLAGAECVIGPHGAGLTNIIFCQAGTSVIEIMPDRDHRPHFWAISVACELPYALVEASAVTASMEMLVDVETVERVAKRMLA